METKINNWVEQGKFFGLDYSTAKAKIGDYVFDIRYDCDGTFTKNGVRNDIKPVDCGLAITIAYKEKIISRGYGKSVQELKDFSEKWLQKEVLNYYQKHCTIFSEAELTIKN